MLYLARIKRSRSPVAQDPLNLGLGPENFHTLSRLATYILDLANVIVGSLAGNCSKTTKFCPCLVF